jgi:hypothetical protein
LLACPICLPFFVFSFSQALPLGSSFSVYVYQGIRLVIASASLPDGNAKEVPVAANRRQETFFHRRTGTCMNQGKEKKIIGRRELVDFPALGLFEIEAKIDTGAYTSALHCSNIHEETKPDGRRVICFELLDPSHPAYNHKRFEFEKFSLRDIKNSFGDVQERYIIRTQIRLYEEVHEAEFSLSDRSDLKYPVLIGRALIRRRYIVDVAKKHQGWKAQQKLAKRKKKL